MASLQFCNLGVPKARNVCETLTLAWHRGGVAKKIGGRTDFLTRRHVGLSDT